MKTAFRFLIICFTIAFYNTNIYAQNNPSGLVEEEKSFWDVLLKDSSIKNKNLFYASYIAYRNKLNDLSIETFRESININESNDLVKGIANYYIGKNLYKMSRYHEAITHFNLAQSFNFDMLNYIKFAIQINTAIAYRELSENDKSRDILQKVIDGDKEGKYKNIANDILSGTK